MDADERRSITANGFIGFIDACGIEMTKDIAAVYGAGIVVSLGIIKRIIDEVKDSPDIKTKKDALDELEWEVLEFANDYTHQFEKKEEDE